jgi:hypothetical protein
MHTRFLAGGALVSEDQSRREPNDSHALLARRRGNRVRILLPLLALFGHGPMSDLSPLSGEERKSNFGAAESGDDPFQKSLSPAAKLNALSSAFAAATFN